jgi:hypothetical protein
VSDAEWELKKNRAVLTAFQTGRPVFADSEGELRFVDGDGEPVSVPDEAGVPVEKLPRAKVALRKAARASYWAAVTAGFAAACNAGLGYWRSWHFIAAILLAGTALFWLYVRRSQLEMAGDRRRRVRVRK